MLVRFTLKNFRSFRDERTFDMEAASIKEHGDAVKMVYKYKLLPVAIIYGANSGGKSNLIKAIGTMRRMVMSSVKLNDDDTLPYDPFALDEISHGQPTSFEVQFVNGACFYRYGFEYNEREIVAEWLYEKIFGEKEYNLFVRSHDYIEVSKTRYKEGLGKEGLTERNRLFLSLVAQLKGEKSKTVMDCFRTCNVLSGLDSQGYENFTLKMFLEQWEGTEEAELFFKKLQLGFNSFAVKETKVPKNLLEEIPGAFKTKLEEKLSSGKVVESLTSHGVYDENGRLIGERSFDKDRMESEGTKKIIEMSGPIFDTLRNGKVLFVDELDAKLHPLLTRNIVLLFMDPAKNKNNAQLIFATHDTNLLDLRIIRRDQIWFAEKDKTESTDLYSLVEFKDENGGLVRNDRNIEKDYISGRYGAIPFIGR